MTQQDTSTNPGGASPSPDWYQAAAVPGDGHPRLAFDQDIDVCVVGGGLAGLSVAREAARQGASVMVLDSGLIAGKASGVHFGLVAPGYPLDPQDLIARVGVADAKALWQLALDGLERVRADAARWPGVNPVAGWLQASTVEAGDELIARLQILGSDFGVAIEGWQVEQVRAVLRSERYFHAIHYPTAFAVHARNYAHGLAAEATRLGVRLFANTPVTAIDAAGIRKRVDTPFGRIRASYIVLAGNVHLGSAAPRLGATLLPVWRSVGVTAPLGDKLAEVIAYSGAVTEAGDADRYRIVDGNRLMWAGPPTTFQPSPAQARRRLAKRVAAAFPQFGAVAFDHVWSGVYGQTVHGMPQIGELRPGLWVASGFGPQGLNTTAMAGELVVSGMLAKDDRWRLFSPFELVWAGGSSGRVVGQAIFSWIRGRTAVAGRLSRHHEQARRKEQERERRLEAANQAARMARPPGDAGGDSATPQ